MKLIELRSYKSGFGLYIYIELHVKFWIMMDADYTLVPRSYMTHFKDWYVCSSVDT